MDPDYKDSSVYGVVVVVHCESTNKFLIIKELKSKPIICKESGMLAFPSETVEPEDGQNPLVTARRCVNEEIGSGLVKDDDIFVREKPLETLPHDVRVYVAWVSVDEEFEPNEMDDDVEFHDWLDEEEICEGAKVVKFRVETMPALRVFKRGRGGARV